ncbi:DUF2507 domain-containing protein [Weissella soli]|uniref:DUF2507 domain-containing protein n=1 Tax=Weissella soli TaxID=155866 RepID=UPI0035A019DF
MDTPQNTASLFALMLLRDRLLPDLLKEDIDEITYWAGKNIAREIDLNGIAAIENFFTDAGFGHLTMLSQKAAIQRWQLDGPIIEARLDDNPKASFELEAGFLAQQTEQQVSFGAETQTEISKNKVIFTVMTEVAATLQD